MARARNIKPGFFINEQVSDNCPLGRLLFIGLWTVADYKGDLEWKEKTLKIQLLPWDNCDLKQLAINLDKSGLIRFYSDGVKIYVNIPTFVIHQNPHKNEKIKGSDIPHYSDSMRQAIDLQGLTINRDKSGLKPECSQSDRADSLLMIPDSCFPITESPLPIPEVPAQAPKRPKAAKNFDIENLDFSSWPEKPDQQILADWVQMRKQKRATITQTVVNDFGRELQAAVVNGFTVNQCLSKAANRGWQGFEAAWMNGNLNGHHPPQNNQRPSAATLKFTPQDYSLGINPDGSF